MDFETLYNHTRGLGFAERVKNITIVGIDPGETTGICTFRGINLVDARQLITKDIPRGGMAIQQYLRSQNIMPDKNSLDFIVMEEYRVYAWKAKMHSWGGLHTPRLIGAIEYIAYMEDTPVIFQGAGEGKGFCTDEKLQEWGFHQTSHRHANDAVRHVTHNLLFSTKSKFL